MNPGMDTHSMETNPLEAQIDAEITQRNRHIRRLKAVGDSVFHAARLSVDSALPREIIADVVELLAADVKRLEASKAQVAPSIFEEPPPAKTLSADDEAAAALAAIELDNPRQSHPPRNPKPNITTGTGKPK
jgi:hypothetical protein